MRQVKHTPGPWKVVDRGPTPHVGNPDFARYWVASGHEYGSPVCEVNLDGVQHDEHQVIAPMDHAANARLIAASPDMYSAIERYLRVAADGEGTIPDLESCQAQLRAALAKAEGSAE